VILASGTEIGEHELRVNQVHTEETQKPETRFEDLRQIEINTDLKDLTQRFERAVALEMLERPSENQATVAKRLGISVRTLQRIIGRDATLTDAIN